MILLDTNVVSAVMKPQPIDAVISWLDQSETADLYLSTITVAEIEFGILSLPKGKRRLDLAGRFNLFLHQGFVQRILTFDEPAARLYGELMTHRRRLGRPMSILDGQIAAIARAHRCAVATGNVKDFEECDLEIVNPFDFTSP